MLCAGCEIPYVPEVECAVGETTLVVRAPPPYLHDVLVVVDTHGAAPEREEVAAALERTLLTLGTGDRDGDGTRDFRVYDEDLRVVVSAAGCGAASEHHWVERFEISDPATLAREVGDSIRALPACDRSVPLAAATAAVSSLRTDASRIDVVLWADEDEPGASAAPLFEAIGDEPRWVSAILVGGCLPGEAPPALDAAVQAVRGEVVPACGDLPGGLVPALTARIADGCYECWCVPRVELTSDEELAPCDLLEELGPRGDRHHCEDLPGREPIPVEITEDGREVCRVIQRAPSDPEPGFRLDREPRLCGERGTHLSMVGTELEPDATATLRCVTIGPHGECAP